MGRTPRGAALARVLDALEADERTRARVLHAADPVHARVVLAPTRLGAPPGVGMAIRGMGLRRGVTQVELARLLGVDRATIARWEAGDVVPSAESVHALGFALGATVTETLALAQAKGSDETPLSDDPESPRWLLFNPLNYHGLAEVATLGFEALLWRRAVCDARWERHLGTVLGARASRYFIEGRLDEVAEPARRAIRLASTPKARVAATAAVGDARGGGAGPGGPARGSGALSRRVDRAVAGRLRESLNDGGPLSLFP